jgi:uncharacterized protein YoxC
MSIEWFRDLAICIAGITFAVAAIFIAALAYSYYRRIKPIIESIKATSSNIQGISECIRDDLARPLAEIIAIIQGITQAINAITNMFKKKGGDSHV